MDDFCGICPGDDASTVPTPPPPPTSTEDQRRELYNDASPNEFDEPEMYEQTLSEHEYRRDGSIAPKPLPLLPRSTEDQRRGLYNDASPNEFDEPEMYEQTWSEHEYLREPVFKEEYDFDRESQETVSTKKTVSSKKRRTLLCALTFLLLFIVAALAVATTLLKQKSENLANGNNVASSISVITAVPVEFPTEQPRWSSESNPTEMTTNPQTNPPISTNSPTVPATPVVFPQPTNPTLPTNPPSKPPTNPSSESSPTFFPTPIHSRLPKPTNMLFPASTEYPNPINVPSYDPYYPPHNYPQSLPTNPPSEPATNLSPESSPTFFPTPIHSSLPKPTNIPFPASTKYPSLINVPSYYPYYPPYNYPQSVCKDKISVDKECYLFGEPIKIAYELCYPGNFYWFGIFQQGSCDRYGRMRMNPYYWELPCGGQGEYWVDPQEHGIVTFNANLSAGQYQVYSISSMNRPYQSTSSSYGFVVSNQCL